MTLKIFSKQDKINQLTSKILFHMKIKFKFKLKKKKT